MTPTETDWQIRLYIYEALATGGRAPNAHNLAARFDMSTEDLRQALQRLHDPHALVLREGSGDILMAHPLSAVPTDYRVLIDNWELYANCAWDSLGIPAMLGTDARVEARHPLSGEVIEYSVTASQRLNCGNEIVHFALPFRQWHDDIVDT
jgi:hypothetical protein